MTTPPIWPEWRVWGWVCAQIAACWLIGLSVFCVGAVWDGDIDWRVLPMMIVPQLACVFVTLRLPLPPSPKE